MHAFLMDHKGNLRYPTNGEFKKLNNTLNPSNNKSNKKFL